MARTSSCAYAPIPVKTDLARSESDLVQKGLNEDSDSALRLRRHRRQRFQAALTSLSLLCLIILSIALGRLTVTNYDCGIQLSTWCKLRDG